MENIKFINLEEIYANTFKNFQEQEIYWKKYYPHIFFPLYDLKRFEEGEYTDIYLEFLRFHHEIIMINNNLFNYLGLGKSFKETYKSLSDKYTSDYQEYDSEENNANRKVFLSNKGHEKFINSFDFVDRSFNLQMLEEYEYINQIFLPQFCALIFVKFEEYLKKFAMDTVVPEKKISFSDKFSRNKFKDKQEYIFSEISAKYKRLPTMLKYAKMIDENCKLEDENSVTSLLKKNRFRNFNTYRNCVIHSDASKSRRNLLPLDCFYLQKEMLDFIFNNNNILNTKKKMYDRLFEGEWLA